MYERQRGRLESLFYIIIVPLVFTSIFSLIFISVLDIPVWKSFKTWGNTVPIVKYIVPGENSIKSNTSKEEVKDIGSSDLETLKDELIQKNEKISELKEQINANKKSIENLQKSKEELQAQLEVTQTKEFQKQMQKVAEIYSDIPASKAAAMLEAMPLEEATLTLAMVKQKQQSSILGSMKDAKRGAEITMILKDIVVLNETDQAALQAKIHEIAMKNENPTKTLAQTISGMPTAQSAGIIQSMMALNSQVAIDVIKSLSPESRTSILAEITKMDAELATKITSNIN